MKSQLPRNAKKSKAVVSFSGQQQPKARRNRRPRRRNTGGMVQASAMIPQGVTFNNQVSAFSIPQFSDVTVVHQEFLGNVQVVTDFAVSTFATNPGVSTTFPWLSQVAGSFEEYDWEKLEFFYRSTSGTAIQAATANLGVVVFATDYNALNPPFQTKIAMESYVGSNSCVPFMNLVHRVDTRKRRNVLDSLYVRNGPVPADGDARFYDIGTFQIATEGAQSPYVCGELWARYRIKLKKPRAISVAGPEPPPVGQFFAHYRENPKNTSSDADPFGTDGALLKGGGIDGIQFGGDGNNYSFLFKEVGKFFVYAMCWAPNSTFSGSLDWANGITAGAAISLIGGIPPFQGDSSTTFYTTNQTSVGLTQTYLMAAYAIEVTSPFDPDGDPLDWSLGFTNIVGQASGSLEIIINTVTVDELQQLKLLPRASRDEVKSRPRSECSDSGFVLTSLTDRQDKPSFIPPAYKRGNKTKLSCIVPPKT